MISKLKTILISREQKNPSHSSVSKKAKDGARNYDFINEIFFEIFFKTRVKLVLLQRCARVVLGQSGNGRKDIFKRVPTTDISPIGLFFKRTVLLLNVRGLEGYTYPHEPRPGCL